MGAGQNPFSWIRAEPTDGNFVWDDSVTNISNAGMNVLASVGTGVSTTPAYALSGGVPVTSSWRDLLTNLVNHYEPLGVKYWEILNEPDGEGGLLAADTQRLTTNAIQVIKAEATVSTIIAPAVGNTVWEPYVADVFNGSYLGPMPDVLSFHGYPGEGDGYGFRGRNEVSNVAASLGWTGELWNTESGTILGTGLQKLFWEPAGVGVGNDDNRNYVRGLTALRLISRMAQYSDKYFWYDGRTRGNPHAPGTYAMFDIDATLKQAGVVMATTIHFLEGTTWAGSLEYGPEVYATYTW
jgi:hypothetical protein